MLILRLVDEMRFQQRIVLHTQIEENHGGNQSYILKYYKEYACNLAEEMSFMCVSLF